jgi:hypothetical protein
MLTVTRRLLACSLATALASSGAFTISSPESAAAAPTPWTLPTAPPKCTTAQINTGDVAGCIILAGVGNPEARGWPTPPFPEAAPGAVIPWVDLTKGASGPLVVTVQEALIANGATIAADGQFGSVTETAVKSFQTSKSLPATGIVNQATADLLGVQNTGPGTFPAVGWKWLGYGYNGSAALANWETQLVRNTAPIGAIKVGQLRSFAAALPLFEGFLAEIQANGYVIGDAGMYVFRCTASTRKDCAGLTRSSLSNHSYGLAIDMNTAKNPLQTYYGLNGASACATPILTDMPQWVVQTGEKWGLYWGGYGWSSGCSSPAQAKSSASRDPMHFEFSGTVAQAQAILAYNRGAQHCFSVADSAGVISAKCVTSADIPGAGTRVVVSTQAPAGAVAALVNITTTSASSAGYITAESCGAAPDTPRTWSNGNPRTGRAIGSTAIVPIDGQGRFCIFQSAPMHTIVDVQGYFAPASSLPNGNLFTPVGGVRTNDTRTTPFCLATGECFTSGPPARGAEVVNLAAAPVDAVATVANLTVTGSVGGGYLTADRCESLTPGPQTRSNLNFAGGDIVANLGVVPSTATDQGAQFCIYSPSVVQQVVDVRGFFGPAAQGGLGYNALVPSRVIDSRKCWTDPITKVERCAQPNAAGSVVRMRAPAGASVVVVNLTSVDAAANGSVTADSCTALRPGPQTTSNLNATPGFAVSNVAFVPVAADGTYCVTMSAGMHLVVDLIGSFSTDGPLRYMPITPVRVHDSRPPA